jgi:hypothetical protein
MPESILTYSLVTSPTPLQASAKTGGSATATLTVMVTNGTPKAYEFIGIGVTILIGAQSTQLTNNVKINPVPPAGWPPAETNTGTGSVLFAYSLEGKGIRIEPKASVYLTFNNIDVNAEPGITNIKITEALAGVGRTEKNFPLTKFPNTWRLANLWVDSASIPFNTDANLHWENGPEGASYRITYYDHEKEKEVSLPEAGAPPFKPTGALRLKLKKTTLFNLIIEKTVDNISYRTQQQITVEVGLAPPAVINFFTGETPLDFTKGAQVVTLKWETENAYKIKLISTESGSEEVTELTTCRKRIDGPATFTLQATNINGIIGPEKNLRIQSIPGFLNNHLFNLKTTDPLTKTATQKFDLYSDITFSLNLDGTGDYLHVSQFIIKEDGKPDQASQPETFKSNLRWKFIGKQVFLTVPNSDERTLEIGSLNNKPGLNIKVWSSMLDLAGKFFEAFPKPAKPLVAE